MEEKQILIQATGIKKHFPVKQGWFATGEKKTVKALDGVDVTLYKGETLGVIGESGCGKSTLARVIMHLIPATEGEILFKGEKTTKENIMDFRRKVQMVFQDPYSSLDPRMTVKRIIEEPLRVHMKHLSREEKDVIVRSVVEKVGIEFSSLDKYPHEFSGGQRQRIGIARALVTTPELLICDEPVSALDMSIQAQVLNIFRDLQRDLGLSYLFISHDMSVIKHVSNRIAVMYLGKIVELADKKELFDNTLHPYTKALMNSIPIPDPTIPSMKAELTGEPPSPINPPPGCSFHERCPYATERC
ncbi:MAG: ATP-binding cassette domain-containing protein, partial [Spirochaetales bacterium]|nr:ATP-binding cassette domain-containing protein [Spirochaetales bacterium]